MTAGKYIRPAPAGGPSLTETTARLRARLDTHAQADAPRLSKRPSFRPLPLAELAPAIRQRNDARAARDDEHDLRDSAARELLIASEFMREGLARPEELNRDALVTYTEAVSEVCRMIIDASPPGTPRGDDRRAAMREAVDALMLKVRGAP